jgi:DNA-binding NarL/FixJ family response regulator
MEEGVAQESPEPRFQALPMSGQGASRHSSVMPQAAHHSNAPRVFIADDSAMIRERVAGLLTARAMTVVGQSDTPQGSIDGILSAHPDVVVLDVQLEGGSGLQVLRAVRLAEPGIAFVVFSNNSGPAYRKLYLKEGAERFLDKSSEYEQLALAVERASHHSPH